MDLTVGNGMPLVPRVAEPQESLVSLIHRLATNPNLNPETFKVLIEAAERERLDARKAEFSLALHAIQSKGLRVHKGKQAKNSRYAPLEDIDKVLHPHLQEYGLAVSFDCPEVASNGLMLMMLKVYHVNGYSEPRTLPMPVDDIGTNREGKALRPKVQDHGSTVSYSRRQLLKMTFNVIETDEDDDGELGEGSSPITQDQADTIAAKCDEYGFSKDDRRRVGAFAARLQGKPAINGLGDIRKCDYAAVLGLIEEMRKR